MTYFAHKHFPEELSPEALDHYLSKGWYRMGQSIFTTHFLCFDREFYSAVWVRLDLQDYSFRKSLRKLKRRNDQRFRVAVRELRITREKEQLFRKYKEAFPDVWGPTLFDALYDHSHRNLFHTLEIAIFDGRQLVGFSCFDVGKDSAASIIGIYDPDYHQFSLGFYSMLLEIAFCQERGLRYYYPGYVVPGYQKFDYKLRIGPVEYYDLSSDTWKPNAGVPPSAFPMECMRRQLDRVLPLLEEKDIPSKYYYHLFFEGNLCGFEDEQYFDFPMFLHCFPYQTLPDFLLIVYNVKKNCYQLLRCVYPEELPLELAMDILGLLDEKPFFSQLIVLEEVLASAEEPVVIIDQLLRLNVTWYSEKRSQRQLRW